MVIIAGYGQFTCNGKRLAIPAVFNGKGAYIVLRIGLPVQLHLAAIITPPAMKRALMATPHRHRDYAKRRIIGACINSNQSGIIIKVGCCAGHIGRALVHGKPLGATAITGNGLVITNTASNIQAAVSLQRAVIHKRTAYPQLGRTVIDIESTSIDRV